MWAVVFLVIFATFELRTSWLQSTVLTGVAQNLTYSVAKGPSASIRFPAGGPYDFRLGYATQRELAKRLEADDGFRIESQARWSPWLVRFVDAGFFPVYPTKTEAGLSVLERNGRVLFSARYPEHAYRNFAEIPPLVVKSLLFIENRELLEAGSPYRNPAVEYDRLAKASVDAGLHWLYPQHPISGGSTLAVQLEKFRHSPGGRTGSFVEKGRQIVSASLRSYLDGPNTLGARQRLVTDYLNSMPLAAISGYGEVFGLGDGLQAWYSANFQTINKALTTQALEAAGPARLEMAAAYRQVLSLLVAVKKPSAYLSRDGDALDARVDAYLRALASAGIIPGWLRDDALRVRVKPGTQVDVSGPPAFAPRKAVDAVRAGLVSQLGLASPHDLDRLDLIVRTTLDGAVNDEVTRALEQLGSCGDAAKAGLVAPRLLNPNECAKVVYSVTLYERGAYRNALRVQADNYNHPLNISEGTKLELGSTAKLRTLVTYLELVEALHQRYTRMPAEALGLSRPEPRDRLTRWAIDYLTRAEDRSLPAMLEAAMNRRYSASPTESFFTGGGVHRFENFDAKDDRRVTTVREGFQRSINLVFIRLIRDLVDHLTFRGGDAAAVLEDGNHPGRQAYLARFADREGREFLRTFYLKHRGVSTDGAIERLTRSGSVSLTRLAVLYRSTRPDAGLDEFAAFLQRHHPGGELSDARARALYKQFDPARLSLSDRGYLAGIHPLELWLLRYRVDHPEAELAEVLEASAGARQEAYRWLFRTSSRPAQNRAIRTLLEVDAFGEMHASWRRQGFPFRSLVPSYATAIGSSGDNPAALAELMGIVVNDGVRYRSIRIDQLRFAAGTPYETHLTRGPMAGDRVLSPAVALLLRGELVGVVEHGTARRLAGGVVLPSGRTLEIGGKTGTGDNRLKTGGSSRVINRTAAFAFVVGNRFFGTVIAYVPGEAAGAYGFTSALPVQVFKHLLPALEPVIDESSSGVNEEQRDEAVVERVSRRQREGTRRPSSGGGISRRPTLRAGLRRQQDRVPKAAAPAAS